MKIIELKADQKDLCKTLRLKALQDAPKAFAESYEDALSRDDNYWELVSSSMLAPNKQRMYLAREGSEYIGTVYALLDEQELIGRLAGMWVSSSCRGKGVGKLLFLRVKEWAESLGFAHIKLWAEDVNDQTGAKYFYRSLGFYETGNKNSEIKNLCEMQYDL